MKICVLEDGLALEKNGLRIGQCCYHPLPHALCAQFEITQFEIEPQWRRKGYGSFLCKALLKHTGGYTPKAETYYRLALPSVLPNNPSAPCAAQAFPIAFFEKFGFALQEGSRAMVRHIKPDLTAIAFVQQFLAPYLAHATLCVDATCGNGHDSLFLAQHLGANGHLLALDLQQVAVQNTAARLATAGIAPARYTVLCENHANLAQHAAPSSVDVILFNFGWLPGADHSVFSGQSSSLPALAAALEVLKPGGVLSAVLYSGEGIGHAEKTAVLAWLQALPIAQYTVLVCNFANWADTAPLPCFVLKK